MTHATTQHRGAWSASALDGELSKLQNLSAGNVCKPSHPFAISIFKIASIAKGGYLSQLEALNAIKKTCAIHNWLKQSDIDYQWKRAYKNAKPRHPKEQTSLPATKQESETLVAEILYEFDLSTERLKFLRDVSPHVVGKAETLASELLKLLGTGELPNIPNLTVRRTDSDPNGVTLNLHFPRYSQALADCVFIACSRLRGFIWRDCKTGVFSVWLRYSQSMTQCGIAE